LIIQLIKYIFLSFSYFSLAYMLPSLVLYFWVQVTHPPNSASLVMEQLCATVLSSSYIFCHPNYNAQKYYQTFCCCIIEIPLYPVFNKICLPFFLSSSHLQPPQSLHISTNSVLKALRVFTTALSQKPYSHSIHFLSLRRSQYFRLLSY
jgi:hypothetical protein